jgi:ABC-type uncharacterized transport system involved in gliding motility auxiliary subunit
MIPRRIILRAQSVALIAALLALAGLAAWATLTWQTRADWSYGHRNGLTATSRKLLAKLEKPVTITAFARPGTRVAEIERRLLERYRRAAPSIRIRLVNPDTSLDRMRKLGITTVGELYVSYDGHGEKLDNISESGISNALRRLARGAQKRIVFVAGDGEASPAGKRNYDLGQFGAALKRQGFDVAARNLADTPKLDAKTDLVVLAGAQSQLPPGEVETLKRWIVGGGNLLWLKNPGPLHGLAPIAAALGLKPLAGTVVNTTARGFGIKDPTALIVTHYGTSPVTRDFGLNTLFPDATGFKLDDSTTWKPRVFISSPKFPTSWLMAGGLQDGRVLYRPATDVPGPVPIGISLTRDNGKQRAIVVGDTSFLANRFIGNGGNLDLGLKIVNWLAGEDRFLDITPPHAPDQSLELSSAEQAGIGLGFLAFLPFVFLVIAGGLVLWRRRH